MPKALLLFIAWRGLYAILLNEEEGGQALAFCLLCHFRVSSKVKFCLEGTT